MTCHRHRPTLSARCIVGRDLVRCSELSRDNAPSDLKSMLTNRTVIGRVLEIDEKQTVAFLVYSRHKWLVEILDFGFDPAFADEAAQLVWELQEKMAAGWGSIRELIYCAPDSELAIHLLLKKLGFSAKMMAGDPPLYRFRWKG
jgi:hypothetical protein